MDLNMIVGYAHIFSWSGLESQALSEYKDYQ